MEVLSVRTRLLHVQEMPGKVHRLIIALWSTRETIRVSKKSFEDLFVFHTMLRGFQRIFVGLVKRSLSRENLEEWEDEGRDGDENG